MIEHSSSLYVNSEAGMARFFSRINLDRYRKLASEAIGDGERQQLFDILAKEVSAFRCEIKSSASSTRGSCGAPSRDHGDLK
jgi:hypothetical protein